MHRGPLHGDVATPQARRAAVVKYEIDLALDDDTEVEGLGPVHHADVARGEVDHAADGAALDDEPEPRRHLGVVEAQVGVAVEVRGRRVRVDLVEPHRAALEYVPGRGARRLHDRLALGVVACYERRRGPQVGFQLRWLRLGIGFGGHLCCLVGGSCVSVIRMM